MEVKTKNLRGRTPQPTDVNPNPTPLTVEHGFFVDDVSPIFDSAFGCSGCHDVAGPNGSLVLGRNVSAADIVAGLVNVTAVDGPQFKYVVPGDPDMSQEQSFGSMRPSLRRAATWTGHRLPPVRRILIGRRPPG